MFPLSQKVKMVIYVKSYNCDSTILHNDKAKYLEYVCRSELGFRLFVGGGGGGGGGFYMDISTSAKCNNINRV